MKNHERDFLSQLFPQAECLSYFPHSFLSLHRLTLFWQSCYHRIHSAVDGAEMEGNLKKNVKIIKKTRREGKKSKLCETFKDDGCRRRNWMKINQTWPFTPSHNFFVLILSLFFCFCSANFLWTFMCFVLFYTHIVLC